MPPHHGMKTIDCFVMVGSLEVKVILLKLDFISAKQTPVDPFEAPLLYGNEPVNHHVSCSLNSAINNVPPGRPPGLPHGRPTNFNGPTRRPLWVVPRCGSVGPSTGAVVGPNLDHRTLGKLRRSEKDVLFSGKPPRSYIDLIAQVFK